MEWIIIEDNDSTVPHIKDLIGPLVNVKYISVERDKYPITVAEKRNIGVENATGEIILHMDDDDFYFPEHAIARVKLLMKYPEKEIIGCSTLGAYNVKTQNSSLISDGELSISEASMGYWKKSWEKQKFINEQKFGEYRAFIQNRFDKIIDIPYTFIMIAINHGKNITNKRDMGNIIDKNTGLKMSYWELFDNYTKRVLVNIK
jgi:glycosyltransferase involved in cell wall biosynthesis